MSKPILYEANATNFFNLGLGALSEAKSALVTEERNGSFYFEMDYPIEGKLFSELKNNRLIKVDAGHELKDQRFKIKKISKPIKGFVTVYAEHISYKAAELALRPEVNINNVTAQVALQQWRSNIIDDNEFVVSSNITTTNSTSWNIREVKNPRQALGGVQGSILDVWGGEYRFDNYHISLFRERGQQANAMIAYGRNLIDFEQEENIMNTYTSVYPYAVWTDDDGDEHLITIPGYIIDSEHVGNFPNRNVLPVDFSLDIEGDERPTAQQLDSLARAYIRNNDVGIPKVSIKLNYLDLSKTLDYKDYSWIEEINLCDNVRVFFEKLSVDTIAKVVKVIWNVLLDRYESLEIGEIRTSLSERINTIDSQVREARKEASDARNYSAIAANGVNMVFFGPDEPTATKVGDIWYQEDGTYTIHRSWDGVIWRVINDPRITDEIENKVNQAQAEIDTLSDQIDSDINELNGKIDGNFTSLSGHISNVETLSAQAQSTADQALSGAITAGANAVTAMNDAQEALSSIGSLETTTQNIQYTIDEIEGTLDVKADKTFVDGINQTVQTHTAQISTNAEQISLKASQADVNTLTGRVSTAESQISVQAGQIALKASQSDVNTLTGQVSVIDAQLTVQEGLISSKVSMTEVNGAIDGIEIGGRNLLLNTGFNQEFEFWGGQASNTIVEDTPISGIKSAEIYGYGNLHQDFQGLDTQTYTFSFWIKIVSNPNNGAYQFRVISQGGTVASSPNFTSTNGEWIKHTFTRSGTNFDEIRFRASGPSDHNGGVVRVSGFKVEHGTKATDWQPAPEDTQNQISTIQSEWTQTFSGFETSVTGSSGRLTLAEQFLDGFRNTIFDPSTGQINATENLINGMQQTLYNPQTGLETQVTQLSDGYNVLARQTVQNRVPVDDDGYVVASNWSRGSQVSLESTSGEGFVITQNQNNSGYTQNAIWIPSSTSNFSPGATYNIVIEINSSSGGGTFSYGQTGGSVVTKQLVSGGGNETRFSESWQASNGNTFRLWFHTATNYRIRVVSITEGGGASQAQLAILNNQIDLAVTNGDVIGRLNVQAGKTLIQNNLIYLDGTTVIRGGAFIDDAWITDLNVDNITLTGTLNGNTINIINMNASNIVGDTTDFVRSNWNNAANGQVSISGSGFRSVSGNTEITIGNGRLESWNQYVDQNTGATVRDEIDLTQGRLYLRNGSGNIQAFLGGGQLSFNDVTSGAYLGGLAIEQFDDGARGVVVGSGELRMAQSRIETLRSGNRFIYLVPHGTGRVRTRSITGEYYGVQASEYILGESIINHIQMESNHLRIGAVNNIRMYNRQSFLSIEVGNNIVFHRNLNMQGNNISNQSDGRFKTDVSAYNQDILNMYKSLDFVTYRYTHSDMAEGIHFGLIAQKARKLGYYDKSVDKWMINSSDQIMYNSLGIKQLAVSQDELKGKVLSLEAFTRGQLTADVAHSKTMIEQMSEEIIELKAKLKLLEEAA